MAKKKADADIPGEVEAEADVEVVGREPPHTIADSVAAVMAAATAGREAAKLDLPVPRWGIALKIAPAHAKDWQRCRDVAKALEARGDTDHLDIWDSVAWFAACVLQPKFSENEAFQLYQADPAEFRAVAEICQAISRGTPLPLFMVYLWGQQLEALREAEIQGDVPEGTAKVWAIILRLFGMYQRSAVPGNVDWREVGRVLSDEDFEGPKDVENALQRFVEGEQVEAKNASEVSTPSGELASSGQDEALPSLDAPDGIGQTSTT